MEKKGDLVLNANGQWVKPKAQAKDGSRRGVSNLGKTQKHQKLFDRIQEAVYKHTGMRDFDPLTMLANIAAKSYTGYKATDPYGHPILDEDGNEIWVPPNYELAAATASKIAPYVHRSLKPKEEEPENLDKRDPAESKERVLEAFRGMGVNVEGIEPPKEEDA